jgi:hypothetical protein
MSIGLFEIDDGSAVWEPVTFKVGDRVRVLARPECHYCRGFAGEAGHTGTVMDIDALPETSPGASAHKYWVRFDALPNFPMASWTSEFAACELALIAAVEATP